MHGPYSLAGVVRLPGGAQTMKNLPKLLVLELWGLGDLAIASSFINKATQSFQVTVVAKSYAHDLRPLLWPDAKVLSWHAPWTAFRGKYRFDRWPWKSLHQTLSTLRSQRFDVAVSARWDPRDHLFMWFTKASQRVGFPRRGSQWFLTQGIPMPPDQAHRFNQWSLVGRRIGVDVPVYQPQECIGKTIGLDRPPRCVVHSGAAQPVREWPLDRFLGLLDWLESAKIEVLLICDKHQRPWWEAHQKKVCVPQSVGELASAMKSCQAFVGNDSGPGHLAAAMGLPTLSIFGPQRTEWFRPAHPGGMVVEGADCPYKPCFDACRFETPQCLEDVSTEQVLEQLKAFVKIHLS